MFLTDFFIKQEEADDFKFGNAGGGKAADDDKSDDDKADDDKSDDDKADDDKSDADKSDDDKVDDDKADDDKADDDDFFSEDDKGTDDDKGESEFNFESFATELEIEATTPEEFKEKFNERIEAAKQEVKVDEYSPDAQKLIQHLNENGGELETFFENKEIASLQSVIAMEAEQKVVSVRINELMASGISSEQAQTQAQEEIENLSTKQVKDQADGIDSQAKGLIKTHVQEIVGNREQQVEKERQRNELATKKEVDNLKKYVSKQETFMGIKMTDKAKQGIVRDIESGDFNKIANEAPEASKFSAYMLQKFGGKINNQIKQKLQDQNKKGYNSAVDKATSALHNVDNSHQSGQSHAKKSTGNSGMFKDFAGIE